MFSKTYIFPFRASFIMRYRKCIPERTLVTIVPTSFSRTINTTFLNYKEVGSKTVGLQTIRQIKRHFRCTQNVAARINETLQTHDENLEDVLKKVKWLRIQKATMSAITADFELLLRPLESIKSSFNILKGREWKKTDDFLPLLVLDDEQIMKAKSFDLKCFPERVYKLSEALSFDPYIVSKNCAKHPFIFDLDRELFLRKLKIILDYGVHPEAILRDIDIFRHSEELLRQRFSFLTEKGITRILPWMVKCSGKIIMRTLELREKRDAIEIQNSDYLAVKLNLHGLTIAKLFRKNPFLSKLNLGEVEIVIDFLLERFTINEITNNIEMLKFSLIELKRRMAELESLKIQPIDAKYLAKKKKDFEIFVEEKRQTKIEKK